MNNKIVGCLGVFILIFGSLQVLARGTATSGGGDAVAAEFTAVAHQVVDILESNHLEGVNLNSIDEAVRSTSVHTKDRLFKDGHEVDAINYPAQKMIDVSRTRWSEARLDFQARVVFVLHEYLAVAGISEKNYQISHQLFGKEKRAWEVTCEPFVDLIDNIEKPQPPLIPLKIRAFLKVSGVGDWFDAGLYLNSDKEWKSPNGKPQTLITLTNYEDQEGLGVVVSFGSLMPAFVKLPYETLIDEKTPHLGVVKGIRTWVDDYMNGTLPSPLDLTCTYIKY